MSKFFPDDASGAASDQAESEDTFGESPEGGSEGGVAVITAARRRPTKKQADTAFTSVPKELLKVGGEAVICHSLRSLERAKFDTVVILLGYRGTEIAEHVHQSFKPNSARASGKMHIEIISLGEEWSGTHAESILRAKPALDRLCGPDMSLRPALVVTSDHLFDPSILSTVLECEGDALLVEGELHDTLKDYLLPATAVRVRTSLYAGAQDDDAEDVGGNFWCERVGRRIEEHDAFDAGLARLGGPHILEALAKLAKRGRYFALCDALDIVARKHGLRAVFTEGRPWVAIETEEQYETTRVLLASPTFRDKIPIEVRYKKKPSATSLLDLAAKSEQTVAPAAAAVADEESAVTATCEYLTLSTNGAGGTATFPEEDGVSGSALLVKDGDTLVVLVPVEERIAADDDESDSYGQMLLATTGLRDANDIESVALVDEPAMTAQQTKTEPQFNVVVERRVPLVGWVVLVGATAFQASSALVFSSNGKDDGPDELLVAGWRPISAAICVLPLVVARRVVTRTAVSQDKPPDVPWSSIAIPFVLGVLTFWLSNTTYQVAFTVAASPNNVLLLAALTPLFVVNARFLRLYGAVPTINEVVGMAVGLLGALVCGIAAPAAPQEGPSHPKPLLAAALSIISVICHACYSITTKLCRQKFSAPDLHLLLQLGSAAISLTLLALSAAQKGRAELRTVFSFDPKGGLFGVFVPSNLATYLYCGLVVDTFGTMGFVVALMYFDPLLTSIATLFEPLCAAIEDIFWGHAPLPSLSYFGGVALLFAGASLIVKDEAHTKQVVNANAAVKVKPTDNDTPAKVNSRLAALTASARDKFIGIWRTTKQRARLAKDGETVSLISSRA